MLYVEHVISMFSKWLNFILADFDKNSEAEVSAAYGTGRLILIRLEYYMISYLLRARRQNGSNTMAISIERFLEFCKDILRNSETEALDETLSKTAFDAGLLLHICDRQLFKAKLSFSNGKKRLPTVPASPQ